MNDRFGVLQKIARKGGVADNVRPAVVVTDVFQMGGSLHNQALSDREGYQTDVLADNEQVQHLVFRGGLLHQVQMP